MSQPNSPLPFSTNESEVAQMSATSSKQQSVGDWLHLMGSDGEGPKLNQTMHPVMEATHMSRIEEQMPLEQGPDLNLLPVTSEHDEEDELNNAFLHEDSAYLMRLKDVSPEELQLAEVKEQLSSLDVRGFNLGEELMKQDGCLGRKTQVRPRF